MLRTRVITALALLAGLLAAVFLLPPTGWLVFASAICGGAAWEWGGLGGFTGARRAAYAALVGLACLLVGAGSGLAAEVVSPAGALAVPYVVGALFWLVAAPVWLARRWRIASAAATVAVGLIVLLPPALALAHLRWVSPWLLLGVLAAIWVSDIAAYFTGRAMGRRKLAPAISPGKTWEGAGGAVVGVLAFGLLAVSAALPSARSLAAMLLLVPVLAGFTAVGIVGDLFESLLKRQAGVKDSGRLLPGHGGILDRIDSLTSTLPFAGLAALWLTL